MKSTRSEGEAQAQIVVRAIVLSLALASCAPATRLAGRCPSVWPLAADATATGVGLAVSVDQYNRGNQATAIGVAVGAMTLALLANMSECRP